MVVIGMTLGVKMHVYTAEISGGMVLSIGNLVKQLVYLVFSVFTQSMFDSALNPEGVFWLFGGFSIIGGVHHFVWLKETKGLSYEEKQHLYAPKAISTKEEYEGAYLETPREEIEMNEIKFEPNLEEKQNS